MCSVTVFSQGHLVSLWSTETGTYIIIIIIQLLVNLLLWYVYNNLYMNGTCTVNLLITLVVCW